LQCVVTTLARAPELVTSERLRGSGGTVVSVGSL
jgi:hypothetical protein